MMHYNNKPICHKQYWTQVLLSCSPITLAAVQQTPPLTKIIQLSLTQKSLDISLFVIFGSYLKIWRRSLQFFSVSFLHQKIKLLLNLTSEALL